MGILTVGPGKTYPDILSAFPAAIPGDFIDCYFNTVDTTFALCGVSGITIRAAAGFAPQWKPLGALVTLNAATLTVEGMIIGTGNNSSPTWFGHNPPLAGGTITLKNCSLSFGSGAPVICAATGTATGTTPISLVLDGCTMAETTNALGGIMGVAGASVTKLARATLTITNSTLKTSNIRTVSSNGLFAAETFTKSTIKVTTVAGTAADYAPASTSTLDQSIIDGMTTATGLIAINQTNTTLSGKCSYIIRGKSGTNAVVITNPTGKPFKNCAFHANGTAISSSACVTESCQFSNQIAANYTGGGAIDTTDVSGVTVTFMDLANGDYAPTSASSTRNAGVDCGFTTDILGVAIPQGGLFDVGPFEYIEAAPAPALGSIDNALRRATDIAGVAHLDPTYEIVPTTGTGTLTDIRHLLMVWAGTDKRVQTQELPADMRDVEWPDNHGWMADLTAGNRLWLFDRRPLSTQVDLECQLMLTEDLLWLTTDGIAASYTVAVTHTGRRRNVEIGVKRLDGQLEKYGVADLWENRVV